MVVPATGTPDTVPVSTSSVVTAPWRLLWRLGLRSSPLALAAPLVRTRPDPDLAPVALRAAGADVAAEPAALESAFPHATDRIVVLVPDTDEDESAWLRHLDQVGGTYASRLAALLDWTPVNVRVSPGEGTAVEIATTLQALVDGWPVPVRRIALVGHGRGGLVLRAACALRHQTPDAWHELVSDVVLLGTPHLAVPAGRTMVPLSRRVDEELAGIVTDDVVDVSAQPLPHARYALITPHTRLQQSRLGGLLGDVLWWRHRLPMRPRKARSLFPSATLHHVPTHEIGLVNHPDVHQAMLAWLA
ncbi:hypothetical protein ASD30_01215 [Nocardioides sp. Root140]|nr:hypothetical protein ASD30_01215 [Nocardioides sp. Root140]